MATIAVIGTLDTKGEEHGFVAELIRQRGHTTLVIDVGTLEPPKIQPDISREEVARAAHADLAALVARRDRGEAVTAMSKGAPAILSMLLQKKMIDGVISLGGGGGTSICTAGMRALPIGFPKLMVSTLASGNTSPYVDVKDIVMFPSIVDVAGLNRISRQILTRAAGAICGMVESQVAAGADKPVIVASQFGNTTACVNHARQLLEAQGYEVLVFHATGTGGRTMESLIEAGLVTGVLDITTTEWADELV
ncbi:MAG TPA: Tm-1-like ATP-binding domain-containing protein, partial [Verrucomicrobiae bacterium]